MKSKTVSQRNKYFAQECIPGTQHVEIDIQFVQTSSPLGIVYAHGLYSALTPMAEETHIYQKGTAEIKFFSLLCKNIYQNEAKEVTFSAPYPLPAPDL